MTSYTPEMISVDDVIDFAISTKRGLELNRATVVFVGTKKVVAQAHDGPLFSILYCNIAKVVDYKAFRKNIVNPNKNEDYLKSPDFDMDSLKSMMIDIALSTGDKELFMQYS